MLGVNRNATVVISAIIAIAYTLTGGMHSVAYTDVIQLFFTFFGLWLAIPFVLTSENVDISGTSLKDWSGTVTSKTCVLYIDTFLLIVLGGIPWQPYYQRAMSVKTNHQVKILSVSATALCIVCMVPPTIIGVAAKTLPSNVTFEPSEVLPFIIHEETPRWVSIISLATIR